ncbi:MAG: Glycerol-3-phosphate acyltransferase [Anaerolineales bacterium]|nr:Glycerol-3-phosphate acyltransferase [Anaerolineales bacterium]WKZ46159.1 MAG: glycerol-3-phosphate acyltransferase [Anaerolineales bacterium]
MQILLEIVAVIVGYLLGSIPVGLLIVKMKTGKDLREVESGRTGGTNAFRAAGFGVGLITALLDAAKAAVAVWIARSLSPQANVVPVLAGLAAILGHNYSIFLAERDANGRWRLRGGAGAMPALGGALGLWAWAFPIVFVTGALVLFTLGMASVATLTVGLAIIIIFAVRASQDLMPWVNVIYGLIAEILLIWALRSNIQKIFAGTERVISISLAGWLRARKESAETGGGAKDS